MSTYRTAMKLYKIVNWCTENCSPSNKMYRVAVVPFYKNLNYRCGYRTSLKAIGIGIPVAN